VKHSIKWNAKQEEALKLIAGDCKFVMLDGGAGSGKSFVIVFALVMRALMAPNSVHGCFRETAVSLKNSLFNDTFKSVLRCIEGGELLKGKNPYVQFKSQDMEIHFGNGSRILFAGLDDDERRERLLGMRFDSVFLNEISSIKSYSSVSLLLSRLRAPVLGGNGKPIRLKMLLDCNPPTRSHWSYKMFFKKVQPQSNKPFRNPDDYVNLSMNTQDNLAVLGTEYMDTMTDGMTEREARRMVSGEWLSDDENALFKIDDIESSRINLPEGVTDRAIAMQEWRSKMKRMVVGVDPAMTNTVRSDEHGIVVAGIGEDDELYVFADLSRKGSPQLCADIVERAFHDFKADCVVYETNQGGDWVEQILKGSGITGLPLKGVRAFVGKQLRAEPISALYERHKVHHLGYFKEMEDQLESLTLDYNRTKQGSPDRLDALVFALTELALSHQTKPRKMIQTVNAAF